jgi:hypothetical protein
MSRKSVVINLPGRKPADMPRTESVDTWVHIPTDDLPAQSTAESAAVGPAPYLIDLREPRNAFELTWMLWMFPARACYYWASQNFGQPRPR